MVENAPILSCQHAGLTIEGYSRAAVQSYWRIPELKIGFDLGAHPWDFMGTPTWFVTHVHLDHSFGLTFLFDVLHERPTKRVVVYGEAAKLAVIQEHLLHELLFPVKLPCEYQPLTGDVDLPGGGRLSHFPVDHPGATIGFRLEWPGHSMAYVTDTTANPAADYVEKLRGVDLLIHECNFDDSLVEHAILTGHSTTTPVAQVARAAGVRRLVLTHLNAISNEVDPVGLDVARAIFPQTWLATDGLELEF